MSPARYLEGVVLLAVVVVAVSAGATGLRRRLTPRLTGARARLAEVVLVAEALGPVGLFWRRPASGRRPIRRPGACRPRSP
jgi:hypothetical protein